MSQFIDLKALAKAIVGLADIFSQLAKSIEASIKSGLRSADAIRRARERRRLRNMMKITAHLFRHQLAFTSALEYFVSVARDERGTWEQAKFEILEIRRLLELLEKFVLPYNDALMVRYRRQYLELLTGIDERRELLKSVYDLEYEDAVKNRAKLSRIGKAYVKLRDALREMMQELASLDENGNSLFDEAGNASGPLESLDEPRRSASKQTAAKRKKKVGRSKD
jgi:hypothetical protein